MNNLLDNGTVLPHGLLDENSSSMMAGFNKSYRNYSLRIGVVTNSYGVKDPVNKNKLTNEYDVVVIEQNEDKGSTTILYRNCMSSEGLGSVADFFEMSLRKKTDNQSDTTNLSGQNGAIALLLCLDSMSDKAIIIGFLNNPDRPTTLNGDEPHLEGEYNGMHMVINADGSCSITFKGATDNDGNPLDKTQGNTVITIEKDGSYQVNHDSVTQRLDRNGKASLTAKDDISSTTQKNYNVTASADVNHTATGDFNVKSNNAVFNAQGAATFNSQSFAVNSKSNMSLKGQQFQVEAGSMVMVKAPTITLNGLVNLGGAGGQPLLLSSTIMLGIGNLGSPVVSTAISGFTGKVMAQ